MGSDVAVGQLVILGIVANILHHAAQILQIDQQQALFVCNAEDDPQNAGLGLIQTQQPGNQFRAHFGDGGTHRQAQLAVNVPEADGVGGVGKVFNAEIVDAPADVLGLMTGLHHTGQVALDVCNKYGYSHIAEGLRQHL